MYNKVELVSMPKRKERQCSRCGISHAAPTGKKCQQNLSSTIEEPTYNTASPTDRVSGTREDHVIQLLTDIKDKQSQFDDRLTQLELSSASKNSSVPQPTSAPQRDIVDDFTSNGIVPTLDALRHTDSVQRQVAERLKGLEHATAYQGNFASIHSGKTIKSGRFRGAEAQVTRNIPWPHELCFVGAARKTVTYDDITPLQFAVGFMKAVQLERASETRDAMIDYYIKLAQDGIDVGWSIARGANAVIYSTLEQGRVDWNQPNEIDRLRMLYTQRASVGEFNSTSKNDNGNDKRRVICYNFNNNKCMKNADHDKDGVTYRHICKFCFSTTRKPFNHPEQECKRKQRDDGTQH